MLVYHFEGVPRNPLTVVLKNIFTFGIHTKLWLYRVNREMDGHEGFHLNLPLLSILLALPIVTPAIVKFQTAARMNSMVSHQVTLPIIRARRLGWISLVPVFGAGFYAYWVQATLNRHWFWHRRAERLRRLRERVTQLAAEPESEDTLARRFAFEEEYRAIEAETAEEVEATRIRMGEERFRERQERAARHGSKGRLSRKEVAALRAETKARRQAERAARRRRLNPRARRLLPRGADPEDDAAWRPFTPIPARGPAEIRAAAERKSREPTRAEQKEIRTAERLVARRSMEEERLDKRRAAARERAAKAALKTEKRGLKAAAKKEGVHARKAAREEKKRHRVAGKQDRAEAKGAAKQEKRRLKAGAVRERKAARGDAAQDKKRQKAARKEKPAPPAPEPDEDILILEEAVAPREAPLPPPPAAGARTPATTADGGGATVRIVRVRCPRCANAVELRKQGDAPAKLTCGKCGLVGKA